MRSSHGNSVDDCREGHCEVDHVPLPRREASSDRQPAVAARALPVPLARGRVRDRRRRTARPRPPAGPHARAPPFVSRGGIKLANALDAFALEVGGRRALDVGASTGGFSDCLLQRGAAHVVALDVAYGELDWRLRSDERVTVIERTNARALRPDDLPYAPDLIVIDVSFISLAKVLGAVLACAAERFDCLALVKPQFEVGRGSVGKGGVVRDAGLRREALIAVGKAAQELDTAVIGYAGSGLPGPKGNRESFVWLAERGREGVEDLVKAAAQVEP
jgi:23S rRNA (cytidine1920-2'-O)/16S rRNA (cytidine1409-2'-O)-methyltransferase